MGSMMRLFNFCAMCQEKNPKKVDKFLREFKFGEWVNCRLDKDNPWGEHMKGSTPLHVSCDISGNHNVVELLLRFGADPTLTNSDGCTPLFLAYRDRPNNDKTIELLLRYGSYLDRKKYAHKLRPEIFENYLMFYQIGYYIFRGGVQQIQRLLNEYSSRDVDFQALNEPSPLYYAAMEGRADIVKLLLDRGARDSQLKIIYRKPAVIVALDSQHSDVLKLFLDQNVDVNKILRDWQGYESSPLVRVAAGKVHNNNEEQQLQMMRLLLAKGHNIDGTCPLKLTAFHQAVFRGYTQLMEFLMERGCDINLLDEKNNSALHQAFKMPGLAQTRRLVTLDKLLRAGADPNIQDYEGCTPLQLACFQLDIKSVELLLKYRADPNLPNKSGISLLQTIMKMVAENDKNNNMNAVAFGVESAKLVKMLMKHGLKTENLDLHVAANLDLGDFLAAILVDGDSRMINVDAKDGNGDTPLHCTLKNGTLRCENFTLLLEHGANPLKLNRTGVEAMKLLLYCKHRSLCPIVGHFRKMTMLGQKLWIQVMQIILQHVPDFWISDIESYKRELERMKYMRLSWSSKVTLYDFMFMKRDQVCQFVDYDKLTDLWKANNGDLRQQFSHFGFLLNHRYRQALARKKLLESSSMTLSLIFHCSGDVKLVEKMKNILRYVGNQGLEKFSLENFNRDVGKAKILKMLGTKLLG